ncbi:MAG: GNAT family N-acetyltransferase, partial [Planctomycetota bacterium]|nr:GNAT family N-acetyltransferase [Planctomycetota bacterium]
MNDPIRRLGADDAEAFRVQRRACLRDEPLAFGSDLETNFANSLEAARDTVTGKTRSVVFGAFRDELVGIVGVMRSRHLKEAHKVWVWGMYVRPEARGVGLGRGLLDAVVAHARGLDGVSRVTLSVTTAATAARRLYE